MENKPHSNSELGIDLSKGDFAAKVFWTFFAIDVVLMLLDLLINYANPDNPLILRRIFNIAREDGIGTPLGSFQTLCISFVLGLLCLESKASQLSASTARMWGFLSGFFCYLAFDDVSGLHERLGSLVEITFHKSSGSHSNTFFASFPSYTWQICFGPFLAIVLIGMIRHFNREVRDASQRVLLLCALACYVLAVFYDFLEGVDGLFGRLATALSVRVYTVSHISKAAEEFLELLGSTFFLTAFIKILVSKTRTLKVSLR